MGWEERAGKREGGERVHNTRERKVRRERRGGGTYLGTKRERERDRERER